MRLREFLLEAGNKWSKLIPSAKHAKGVPKRGGSAKGMPNTGRAAKGVMGSPQDLLLAFQQEVLGL
jgi:hypothetical protein